jgi:hypothetical protein
MCAPAGAADGFDRWADERERVGDGSVSARFVSSGMTGYEELDRNGSWSESVEYGPCGRRAMSVPTGRPTATAAGSGWRMGLDLGRQRAMGLCAIPLWPLGVVNRRWCWAPGRVHSRPAWAPALVGWVDGTARPHAPARHRLVSADAARPLCARLPRVGRARTAFELEPQRPPAGAAARAQWPAAAPRWPERTAARTIRTPPAPRRATARRTELARQPARQ